MIKLYDKFFPNAFLYKGVCVPTDQVRTVMKELSENFGRKSRILLSKRRDSAIPPLFSRTVYLCMLPVMCILLSTFESVLLVHKER